MVLNKATDHIPADAVYVGRPTRWGNPFTHRPDLAAREDMVLSSSREEAVASYRDWLWARIRSGEVSLDDLAALHGKPLVCWCSPLACHADVLAAAASWATVEQLGRDVERVALTH